MSEIWLDCPLNTSIRWLKDQKVERLHWRTFFLNSIRVRTSQYLIENTIICEAKIWCFFFSNLHILTWIAWFLASEGLLDAFHNVCACRNYFILGNRKIWGCQFSYITENHIWHIIICIKQYLDMAAIQEYCTRICFLSRNGVVQERKELFRNINDDAFFLIKSWPADIKMIFWRKPKTDRRPRNFQIDVVCWGEWLFARLNANVDFAVTGLEWCQNCRKKVKTDRLHCR